jgi:hypothetical protein
VRSRASSGIRSCRVEDASLLLMTSVCFRQLEVRLVTIADGRYAYAIDMDERGQATNGTDEDKPWIYRKAERPALIVKALIQMLIGLATVSLLGWRIYRDIRHGSLGALLSVKTRGELFDLVGYALAAAAVVELAHTLYTHGPDEALDPLMLAISAALLLQLGKVEVFDWRQGIAALLYVAALGGLFVIRDVFFNGARKNGEGKRGKHESGGPPASAS